MSASMLSASLIALKDKSLRRIAFCTPMRERVPLLSSILDIFFRWGRLQRSAGANGDECPSHAAIRGRRQHVRQIDDNLVTTGTACAENQTKDLHQRFRSEADVARYKILRFMINYGSGRLSEPTATVT